MPVYTMTLLCASALVLWVYHYDDREKEPAWAVLLAVAFGFASMWLIGLADDYAITTLSLSHDQYFSKAACIALIEEGGKLISIILLTQLILRKYFNDSMDGLIYGRLIGLGMAVEESLLYLSLSPATLQTFGIEIVRLFAHSLLAGLVGFAIGIGARPNGKHEHQPRLVILCLALSTTVHFAWNLAAYGEFNPVTTRILPMTLMLTLMLMWQWFCAIARARSREFFA